MSDEEAAAAVAAAAVGDDGVPLPLTQTELLDALLAELAFGGGGGDPSSRAALRHSAAVDSSSEASDDEYGGAAPSSAAPAPPDAPPPPPPMPPPHWRPAAFPNRNEAPNDADAAAAAPPPPPPPPLPPPPPDFLFVPRGPNPANPVAPRARLRANSLGSAAQPQQTGRRRGAAALGQLNMSTLQRTLLSLHDARERMDDDPCEPVFGDVVVTCSEASDDAFFLESRFLLAANSLDLQAQLAEADPTRTAKIHLPYPRELVEGVLTFLHTGSLPSTARRDVGRYLEVASAISCDRLVQQCNATLFSTESVKSPENMINTMMADVAAKPVCADATLIIRTQKGRVLATAPCHRAILFLFSQRFRPVVKKVYEFARSRSPPSAAASTSITPSPPAATVAASAADTSAEASSATAEMRKIVAEVVDSCISGAVQQHAAKQQPSSVPAPPPPPPPPPPSSQKQKKQLTLEEALARRFPGHSKISFVVPDDEDAPKKFDNELLKIYLLFLYTGRNLSLALGARKQESIAIELRRLINLSYVIEDSLLTTECQNLARGLTVTIDNAQEMFALAMESRCEIRQLASIAAQRAIDSFALAQERGLVKRWTPRFVTMIVRELLDRLPNRGLVRSTPNGKEMYDLSNFYEGTMQMVLKLFMLSLSIRGMPLGDQTYDRCLETLRALMDNEHNHRKDFGNYYNRGFTFLRDAVFDTGCERALTDFVLEFASKEARKHQLKSDTHVAPPELASLLLTRLRSFESIDPKICPTCERRRTKLTITIQCRTCHRKACCYYKIKVPQAFLNAFPEPMANPLKLCEVCKGLVGLFYNITVK